MVLSSAKTAENGGLLLYHKRRSSSDFEVLSPPNDSGVRNSVRLPPGQVVEVLKRHQNWVKLRADVSSGTAVTGWTELYSDSSDGRQRETDNYNYVANLCPIGYLEFSRHGKARPLVTYCGHAIHAQCWDTYMASCLSSHINSRLFESSIIVNPEAGEVSSAVLLFSLFVSYIIQVVCPMCKSISNSFLPIYSSSSLSLEKSGLSECATSNTNFDSLDAWLNSSGVEASDVTGSKDLSKYQSPYSCRSRDLAEAILSHSQLDAKIRGNYGDDVRLKDKYGYKSGNFRLNASSPFRKMAVNAVVMARRLHALWASMAYSLLSSVFLESSWECESAASPRSTSMSKSGEEGERRMLVSLFRVALSFSEWGFSDFSCNLCPLEDRLLLRKSSIDFDDQDSCPEVLGLLVSLSRRPLPVVFDLTSPDDGESIHALLNEAIGKMEEDGRISLDKLSSLWPVLHQPVLAQDLYMLVIASLCSRKKPEEAIALSSLVCIARLVQILIEPTESVLVVANCEASKKRHFLEMKGDAECEDLEREEALRLCKLRSVAMENIGCDKSADMSNSDLGGYLDAVRSKWAPFLEYVRAAQCLLKDAVGASSLPSNGNVKDCKRSFDRRERLSWLLREVGLGGVNQGQESAPGAVNYSCGLMLELAAGWGRDYKSYYDDLPCSSSPSSSDGLLWSGHLNTANSSDSDEEEGSEVENCLMGDGSDDENDSGSDEQEEFESEFFQMMDPDIMESVEDVDWDGFHDEDGEDGGEHDFEPQVVGDGYGDYEENGDDMESNDGSNNDDMNTREPEERNVDDVVMSFDIPEEQSGDQSDEEGGVGVRDEVSQWLREMSAAFTNGGAI